MTGEQAYGERTGDGARVRVKVVPGAKRAGVAGLLGDRLKLRVRAPAESGRANREAAALLAAWLGVEAGAVTLVAGARQPRKCFLVKGVRALRSPEDPASMGGSR